MNWIGDLEMFIRVLWTWWNVGMVCINTWEKVGKIKCWSKGKFSYVKVCLEFDGWFVKLGGHIRCQINFDKIRFVSY